MQYVIDSFLGLSDFSDRGIRGAFRFGSNMDVRKKVDSLSCGQSLVDEGLDEGRSPSASISPSASASRSVSATPSSTPSATKSPSASISATPSTTPSSSISSTPSTSVSATPSASPSTSGTSATVFEDLVHFFVKATDGYTYGFGNTGCIYRRDADNFWIKVYTDGDGAIKGAEEKPSSTGKIYLVWATDTKVKRKDIGGASNWNDVETVATNLLSQDWHTIKQVGGAAYICNGPLIAMVGYDDSYSNEILDLIPGNLSKTIVERDGEAIIGTGRTLDPTTGINAAIDTEKPLSQIGDDGEIFFADMVSSMPVKVFPGGGKVNPGGVCNKIDQANFFRWDGSASSWIDKQSVGNMALFAVYEADTGRGGIYSYGRTNKNAPFTLNLDHQLDADELGAIVSVDGTVLVSYRDDTDYGVKAVDSTAKATAIYEGLELFAPAKGKKPTNITRWSFAEIFCEGLPDGSQIEFFYRRNKVGGWVQAKMEGGFTAFTAHDETKAVFLMGDDADIIEPRVVVTPTGNTSPDIRRIKLHLE